MLPVGQFMTTPNTYTLRGIVDGTSVLTPYIKNTQVGVCPSNSTTWGYGWPHNHHPYQTNPVSMGSLNYPAEQMMFCDSDNFTWVYCSHYGASQNAGKGYVSDRHNGGSNVSFMDGHAKWMTLQSLRATDAAGYRLWLHTL